MKVLITFLSCFFFLSGYNQIIIRGHVREYKSLKGISDAQVSAAALENNLFFTDRNGYFELNLRKTVLYGQSLRLIITAKGYSGWDEIIPVSQIPMENIFLKKNKDSKNVKKTQDKKNNSISSKTSLILKRWSQPIEKTLHVNSSIDTKINIVEGDSVIILTTGFISLSEQFPHVNSSGLKSSNHQLEDKFNIAPDLNYGALIVKVGDSEWLPCGYERSGYAKHSGKMILAINDTVLGDNDGYFEVKIQVFHLMK